MKKILLLATLCAWASSGLAWATPAAEPPKRMAWSFEGVFGTYDRGTLQRGFQVYKEVCASCHGLSLVAFHDLAAPGGPSFSERQAKAIAAAYKIAAGPNERGETTDDKGNRLTRPGTPADHFPVPFANEQAARAVNGGALPPDLSLIVKARQGGADYIYALLTGFAAPPQTTPEGKFYNRYFPGHAIAMPPPLMPDSVTFSDGTPATVDNEAKAVTTFLAWASEPQLEARHRLGFQVLAFLVLLAGLLGLTYYRVWYAKAKAPPKGE